MKNLVVFLLFFKKNDKLFNKSVTEFQNETFS